MSKFKSECWEGGERVILSSGDPGGRTGGRAFSQIHTAPCVWLTDGYKSLNHLDLNLMGATGDQFDTGVPPVVPVKCNLNSLGF